MENVRFVFYRRTVIDKIEISSKIHLQASKHLLK